MTRAPVLTAPEIEAETSPQLEPATPTEGVPVKLQIDFLVFRNGDLQRPRYRREIPHDLRPALHRREFVVNLKRFKGDQTALLAEVRRLTLAHDALFAQLRAGQPLGQAVAAAVEAEALPIRAAGPEAIASYRDLVRERAIADRSQALANQGERPTSRGARIGEYDQAVLRAAGTGRHVPRVANLSLVYEADKAANAHRRRPSEKTRSESVQMWIAANGDDIAVAGWKREHVMAFVKHLREKRKLSDASIKRRVSDVRGVYHRHFIELSRDPPPIWKGLNLDNPDPTLRTLPLHRWHIGLLTDYLATASIQATTKNAIKVMMASTLGPSELTRIRPEDVDLTHAVPHIRVTWREAGQKSAARVRFHPLVAEALEAFLELEADAKGRFFRVSAPVLSQRLAKTIRAAGIPKSPRLRPYSFRHGLKQALSDSGCPSDDLSYLMGHSAANVSDRHGYGSGPALERLRERLIAALPFRGNGNALLYSGDELPADKR